MKNLNVSDDINQNLNINESIEINNIKQSLSGGIDPDRIVNKEFLSSLGDFYKCCICFRIMIKPTDCEECGHSYCQECITKLKCPFGCRTKSLKPSSIGILNLLKNLKFNCQNEGCDSIIPYIEVKSHDANCEYQKVLCTNKRCKKRIIKKELENHVKNLCKYTLIKCKYCNTEYIRKEIKQHEKLCALTFQYLKNYKNKSDNNKINENDIFDISEKNFNKYIQSLSVNITKILKENNNFKNENNEINTNKTNDKNIETKKSSNIKNENDKNQLNMNMNIESKKSKSKINENKNTDYKNNNTNSNTKNYNDESKQSLAQIEEDDLVDIIKKAIEEKLGERFANYDINFAEFCQDLKDIKGCVCKLNIIKEVKESEEEDDDESNNSKNINNNRSFSKEIKSSLNNTKDNNISLDLDISDKNEENIINESFDYNIDKNNLNSIKDNLKYIIVQAEIKIKTNIIQLNEKISQMKAVNNNNEKDNKICDEDINNDDDDVDDKKGRDNKDLEIINQNIEEFANKIIEVVKETKIKINNLNDQLKNYSSHNLIVNEENKSNIKRHNNYDTIIDKVKNILQNIVEKNNINVLIQENCEKDQEQINHSKEEKEESSSDKNNDNNNNIINNFGITNLEIKNCIDAQFQSMNTEINDVNKEMQSIKEIIEKIKSLIASQYNDISNQIINRKRSHDNKNLIKEISSQFFNNKKTLFFSGIKSVKTIQPIPKKMNSNNILYSIKKIKKLREKYNSAKSIFPMVKSLENLEYHERKERSYSSNSLYFYGSTKNICEKQDKDKDNFIDNDVVEKLLNIENKIKSIYEFMETIPDIVKEKINIDIFQNMFKLKEKVNKNLDEKIKSIFSLKFCEECEKIEYFYGFKKCSNCSNDCCKNCVLLCTICKNFLCKACMQKGHQCDKNA